MLKNTHQTYGLVAQVLHWLTAGFILMLLPLGLYMHDLPTTTPAEVDYKIWTYSLHKTLGILAFATALLRVLWALAQPHPRSLHAERRLESILASGIHWVLYGSILLMPITGWLHHAALEGFAPIWWPFSQDLSFVPKDSELAEWLGTAHQFTAWTMIGSLFLHIAGALKHQFVDRDQTLARMLPWKRVEISDELSVSQDKSHSRFLAGGVFVALAFAIVASQYETASTAPSENETATLTPVDAGWVVDPENSSLDIEVIQNKNPVKGNFANWQADIVFDPDAIEKASVTVRVKIESLTLGGVTKDALSANFLNAVEFPEAVFTSSEFIQIEDGRYQANGELSLAGITNPLNLPFDLDIRDGRAFMNSSIELQRLEYGLGKKGYTTDGILGFPVKVVVKLEATAKSNENP